MMNLEKLDLGICILFFNKAEQTIECIESFLPSGVPIYLVNNGSNEESTKKMNNYLKFRSNVTMYNPGKNLGVGPGRNYMITRNNHEWMFFVDNDITVKSKNWLYNIERHIRHSRDIDAFIPRVWNLREGNHTMVCNLEIVDSELKVVPSSSDFTNWMMGGCSIVNKKVFVKFGLYDELIKVGFEDYEFALRGIVRDAPPIVKNIYDIELVHDHRYSKVKIDKESTYLRYDLEMQNASAQRIWDLYKVRFSNYEDWLKEQTLQINSRYYNVLKFVFVFKRFMRNVKKRYIK